MARLIIWIYFCFSLYFSTDVIASDAHREQEFADSVQQAPIQGKIVRLGASERQFLAIYSEVIKADNNNAAIVLHDMGAYPDQKPVVYDIRTQLPLHHWATLSIQMPIRESYAEQSDYYSLFTEAEERILVGITYLRSQGVKNLVIIGYGLSALMASYTVNNNMTAANGLITLSLSVPEDLDSHVQTLTFIKNIALPFLDLYAELDLTRVVETANQRSLAGKDNPMYWQERLLGVDHSYQQNPELLVKRLYSWLNITFPLH